jgi:DegV family protein with EDD domain
MTRIAIVTDSTAYIPAEMLQQHNIYMAPQQVIWGTETFRDGVDMTPTQFYQRLRVDKTNPKTSQTSPLIFREYYERALQSADAVLCLTLSSSLSQTFNSANVAKGYLAGAAIEVVDTYSTAMALGFLTIGAAEAAAAGKSMEEIKALVQAQMPKTGVVFVVDTLDYLHRGGRIGGGARFMGNLLNVKPVLHLKDGKVDALERVRTKKKAVEFMVDHISRLVAGQPNLRLATLHADAEAEARELLRTATGRLGATISLLAEVSPAVGAHTGPGTVGLAWMTD